jgi:hypothetical protein
MRPALQIYYYHSGGGSQAPTFSSSTERCIIAGGNGGDDYITFGDGSIHPVTGDETFPWRYGPDHNSSGTGKARLHTKAFGSNTIYGPVTIEDDPDGSGGINITNVSGNWASATRFIIFWLEINGTNGDMYYRYSDDLHLNITTPASATWSARTRMTTDFGTGQSNTYIDGPGQFIVLQNGDLLKPSWCNSGIVTVYRSTDLGLTWTRSGNITLDAGNPCDETSIVQLDNGTIFAVTRCNSLHVLRTATSTDNGVTWSALVTTTIQSYGKPAICQYNNYVYGIAREYNPVPVPFTSQRTIYFKTSDLVTFETGFIDNREEIYDYGQPYYSPLENKVIVVYAVEGANTTPLQESTRIIRKELTLTASAAVTPPVYDTALQSALDFTQADGGTLPNSVLGGHLSTLFAGARSDGDLALMRLFQLSTYNDTSLGSLASRNLIRPWEKFTLTNNPTLTADGYNPDGTTQSIGLGLTPANLVTSQNSMSVIMYCAENVQSAVVNSFDLGATDSAFEGITNAVLVMLRFSDDKVYIRLNDSTYSSWNNANSIGYYHFRRSASNVVSGDKDGVSMGANSTAVSTARSSTQVRMFACRFSDQINRHSSRKNGLLVIGPHTISDNFRLRWNTYKAAIGL